MLLSYAVVLIKPVLPYVSDFIDHAFFYARHIATVHYENGRYHVHSETAKNTKEDKQDKSNLPSSKKDNTATEHILINTKQLVFSLAIRNAQYYTTTPAIISGISNINYPPPRI